MKEQDFRRHFNRSISNDPTLQAQINFRAHKLRTDFLFSKIKEIMDQKGIYTLKVPSHHHFFKIAREEKIQEVYFGKK